MRRSKNVSIPYRNVINLTPLNSLRHLPEVSIPYRNVINGTYGG